MGGNAYHRRRGIETRTFVGDGDRATVAVLTRSLRDEPMDVTIVMNYPEAVDPSSVHVGNTNWRVHEDGVAWRGVVTPGQAQLCRYEVDRPETSSIEALFSTPRIVDVVPADESDPDAIVVEGETPESGGFVRVSGTRRLQRETPTFETVERSVETVTDRDAARCERAFGTESDRVTVSDLLDGDTDDRESESDSNSESSSSSDLDLDLDLEEDESMEV